MTFKFLLLYGKIKGPYYNFLSHFFAPLFINLFSIVLKKSQIPQPVTLI